MTEPEKAGTMDNENHKSPTQRKRGGKKRTGTIRKTRTGQWQAVITLPGGKQKRLPALPHGTSEAKAREFAAYWSEKTADMEPQAPKVAAPNQKTVQERRDVDQWVDGWLAEREARGLTAVRENSSHWNHHVSPVLGGKHPKGWTRADLRAVSRALDAKVQAKEISHRTAGNIWGTVTRMCDDAANSKHDSIRCRDDNVSLGIRGPERGPKKSKEFLYPSEFLKLANCRQIPLEWRRLITFAVYTYVRDSELKVLRWEDVNLDNRVVFVHRAMDRRTGEIKTTKGKASRRVPIHRELVPMLESMKAESGGEGLLFSLSDPNRMAEKLRTYLAAAGVDRSSLFADSDETRRKLKFHDLRGTGITWLTIAGMDHLKIQRWAGHQQFATTEGYIATADSLDREGFGEPFPALPESLVSCASKLHDGGNTMNLVDATGFESGADSQNTTKDAKSDSGEDPDPAALDELSSWNGGGRSTESAAQETPVSDPVEVALATALDRASSAGEWQVVARLAGELEARRKAKSAPNVVPLRPPKGEKGSR